MPEHRPRRRVRPRTATPTPTIAADERAWQAIIDNYGDRVEIDEPPAADPPSSRVGRTGVAVRRPVRRPRAPFATPATPEAADEADAGRRRRGGLRRPREPPPLPTLAPDRRLAWAGVFGSPGRSLLVLRWSSRSRLPTWLGYLLVVGFVGGFVYLVRRCPASRATRLGRRRPGLGADPPDCARMQRDQRDRRDHRPPDRPRHPVAGPRRHPGVRRRLHRSTASTSAARPTTRRTRVITVISEDDESLQRLLMRLQTRGVNQVDPGEARRRRGRARRRLPRRLLLDDQPRDPGAARRHLGRRSSNPEMDCGLIVERDADGSRRGSTRCRCPTYAPACWWSAAPTASGSTVPGARRERRGVRLHGVRGLLARSRRRCWCARSPTGCARPRPPARRCCGSAGPASCTPARRRRWSRMVDAGYVDVLFAGNALATHDIESSLYGTSLGVDLADGPRRRARPRAPHPGDQHDPQGGLDPRGRRAGRADRRHHARAGHPGQAVRAGRLGARRRPAARRLHRRDRRASGRCAPSSTTSASA